MSIVLITGDHPRHKYFVKNMITTGLVSGWVCEKRESFLPNPPTYCSADLKNLFSHHFSQREKAEEIFFGNLKMPKIPLLGVGINELNSEKTSLFLRSFDPKLIISYGCRKLDAELMNSVACRFWNTHGGLSPEYRGVITHFWPSYFLEPQMTGLTLHETTVHIDGGGIIFQSAPPMVAGDTLHKLAARAVVIYTENLCKKIGGLKFDTLPSGIKQKTTGKIFKARDWRPEHLRVIYEFYEDQIVDFVISGKLTGREPNLLSVI